MVEVLMVRRNLKSDFVGGAYVFPGGAVDPADGGPEAEALCAGAAMPRRARCSASRRAGSAYWVAVVRETFEEAGLLLARRDGGPPCCVRRRRRGDSPRRGSAAGQRRQSALPRPVPRRAVAPLGGPDPLLRPLDHASWCPAALRHPVLRGRGATRAAGRPRRRRDHRRGVDHARRGVGRPPLRRYRDHLSDHPQPPGHRTLLDQHRLARRGCRGVQRRPRHRAPGGARRQRACASCCRAIPPTTVDRWPTPADKGRWATSTRPCVPCRCRRTWRGPTPPRGRDRGHDLPAVPDFGLGPAPGRAGMDEVASGVRRLTAPNPGLMTGPGTNTYLVGHIGPRRRRPGPADDDPHRRHHGRRRTARFHSHHRGHAHPSGSRAGRRRPGRGDRGAGDRFGPAEDFAPGSNSRRGLDVAIVPRRRAT